MRSIQVRKPGAAFEFAERGVPNRESGEVRVRVHSCGICHSGMATDTGSPFWVESAVTSAAKAVAEGTGEGVE
jgi:D-arabinose 1-dehydrogenase-like Zn-dependent alcohol dehydrogenase